MNKQYYESKSVNYGISHTRRRKILELVNRNGLRVLDVACASGYLGERVKGAGNYVAGLEISEAAKDLLGKKGYDQQFGARPLRRVIQNMVEDPLSEDLLRGDFRPGDTVQIDRKGEEISINTVSLVKPAAGMT